MTYTYDILHDIVWNRFVRLPYGHVLDYAKLDGSNIYPSSKECEISFPNPLGWWTPIENGGFFTGLYLSALTEKYRANPDERTKAEINTLLFGLFVLQDAGGTDGFIARGVSDDGKSCYKCSSEDQVCPWLLGMWKAYESEAVSDELKAEIKIRISRLSEGIQKHGFCIPTLWKEHVWGGFLGGDYRSCAKLLGLLRITYEVTKDIKWLDLYEKYGNERVSGPFTRFDVCYYGCGSDMVKDTGLIQFWIHACSQLFIKELSVLDENRHELFRHSLNATAAVAVKFINEYKTYLSAKGKNFDIDWRKAGCVFKPVSSPDEGRVLALEQNKIWMSVIVPERHCEHNILGNMLFGALICSVAEDAKIRSYTSEKIHAALECVDFPGLNLSYAFVAESVLYYLSL